QVFAATALGIETVYIVAIFSRRARPFIGAAGVLFLVGIRMLMGPTFEPFLICALFVVPWHRVEAALDRTMARAWVPRIDAPALPEQHPTRSATALAEGFAVERGRATIG